MFLSLFLSALSKVWVGGIIFGLPGSVLVVVDPSATSVSGRLAEWLYPVGGSLFGFTEML